MRYFIYKLKWMGGSGFSIVRGLTPPGMDIGHTIVGGLLGFSPKPITEYFSPELLSDHEAVEVTQAEAVALLKEAGWNDPQPDGDGMLLDANPRYEEKRGIKYVEALEAEAIKTKPELIQGVA